MYCFAEFNPFTVNSDSFSNIEEIFSSKFSILANEHEPLENAVGMP